MKYCHTRESHTAKAMQTYIGSMASKPVEAGALVAEAVN
jgi:hypothetical protein